MLNITIDEVKSICNLSDLKRDDFLVGKFVLIDEVIKGITIPSKYRQAVKLSKGTRDEGRGESFREQGTGNREQFPCPKSQIPKLIPRPSPLLTAFKTGFAYLLYAECIEFLNTNTSGKGIVSSTGFDSSRVDHIGHEESFERKNSLEYKAYSVLKPYLNEAGLKRYQELKLWDDMKRAGNSEAQRRVLSAGSSRYRGSLI